MDRSAAVAIIKEAITLSNKENAAKNMQNAMQWLGQINGWTQDNFMQKFVEHALRGAEAYKSSGKTYMLKIGNEAENVALYVDFAAADEIESTK